MAAHNQGYLLPFHDLTITKIGNPQLKEQL
jgi:hypothetical protein